MKLIDWLLLVIVLIGHLAIWCGFYNRLHATAIPRPRRKLFEKFMLLLVLILMFLIGYWAWKVQSVLSARQIEASWTMYAYQVICLACSLFVISRWTRRKLTERIPDSWTDHQIQRHRIGGKHFGLQSKLLALVPGNQVTDLAIETKTIAMENWPAPLAGLNICHISDLHFNGKIDRSYFEQVVQYANRMEPDLIFITGDIIDVPECLEWIPKTLGELRAKHGCYYVLGNHDKRIADESLLRATLSKCGIVSVNGEWIELNINGQPVLVSGNELPWYQGAESLAPAPIEFDAAPRLLLSHSPDQIQWAIRHGFDLVFAGHCHGGQIRIPFIGPIVSPSKYGVRFASGVFQFGKTMMLVSRGISCDDPIRLFCLPELSLIELKSAV